MKEKRKRAIRLPRSSPDARMLQIEVCMEPPFWQMLDRYVVIVNGRLKEKGLPRVSRARLTGAILSYFFLAHHQRIQSESDCARLTEAQKLLLSVIGSDAGLRELAEAGGLRLPEVPQVG